MKKKNLVVIGSLVVFALAGSLGYWKWTRSVTYSLKAAAEGIKDHDRDAVEKYVDIEGLTSGIIDEALRETSDGKDPNPLAMGLVELMKPKLTSIVKEKFLSYIEEGKMSESKSEGGALGNVADGLSEMSGEGKFKGIKSVREEGKIAFVVLEFELSHGFVATPELKMRNKGDYWQIVGVNNFMKLVNDHKVHKNEAMIEEGLIVETPSLKKVLSKLKSEEDLRSNIVEKIYSPGQFDDETRKIVENWGLQCKENSDYSCRLASYFVYVEGDQDIQLKLIHRGCESGKDLVACYGVAVHKKATAQMKKDSLSKLESACTNKNFEACSKMGEYHYYDNPREAEKNFKNACENGYLTSCSQLAGMLIENKTPNSDEEIIRLASKACEGKEFSGCNILGRLHTDKKDFIKAKEYFVKGCNARQPFSCMGLGFIALEEDKDANASARAYGKGCNMLDPVSCNMLASLDQQQASDYHFRACKYGHEDSCAKIGQKKAAWLNQ